MRDFLRTSLLVTRREIRSLLTAPLYYVLSGVFFLATAYVFLTLLHTFAQEAAREAAGMTANVTHSVIRETFFTLHFFLMIQVPLLTMRSFAEDKTLGMMDLLQTTPLKDWAFLSGKFAAYWIGFGVYIALGMLFPISVSLVGNVEWPVVISCFAALLFSAGAYTAIGLFFSSITESQVVAAVLSYVSLFFLVLSGSLGDAMNLTGMAEAAQHLTVSEHLNAFLRGNVALMNIVYFLALTAIFLFFSARILESRRWRS